MLKNIVQDIGGVGVYGVISLCLFFAVFFAALLWSIIQRPKFCAHMSALPLQDEKGGR